MPAPASPVRSFPIGEPSLRPLSPEGLARLHAASLRILEQTGVVVGSAGIHDRLAAAGARVDGDRVHLPAALVEAALAAAPRGYTLASREPPGICRSTALTGTCRSMGARPRSWTSTPVSAVPPRRRTWRRSRGSPTRSQRSPSSGRAWRPATGPSPSGRSTSCGPSSRTAGSTSSS